MEIVVGWIVLAVVVGFVASAKGQSWAGMFLVSLLLSPLIGLLITIALRDKKAEKAADARTQALAKTITQVVAPAADTKICPRCAETIKAAAVVCRYCGHEFEISAQPAPISPPPPAAPQERPTQNPVPMAAAVDAKSGGHGGAILLGSLMVIAIVTITLVALNQGKPQTGGAAAKLGELTESMERTLASTDAVVARSEERRAAEMKSAWTKTTDTSAMTGAPEVYLRTISKPYRGSYADTTASLWVRCAENKTSLLIDMDEYLGSDDIRVQFRLDEAPAQTATLNISTDFKAVGWWSGADSIPMIRRMLGAKKMIVRMTPYGESTREVEFNIHGLGEHASDVATACNWSIEPPTPKPEAPTKPEAPAPQRPSSAELRAMSSSERAEYFRTHPDE